MLPKERLLRSCCCCLAEKILNSSLFLKARNDQRPAADHVGHGNFMDHHLKNTLNSGDMDLPGGARAPKVHLDLLLRSAEQLLAPNSKSNEAGDVFLSPRSHFWHLPFRHASHTRYPSRGRNGPRTSTSSSWRPCSSMAVPGAVYKVRRDLSPSLFMVMYYKL